MRQTRRTTLRSLSRAILTLPCLAMLAVLGGQNLVVAQDDAYSYVDPVQGPLEFRPHPEEVVGLVPVSDADDTAPRLSDTASRLELLETEKVAAKLGIAVFRTRGRRAATEVQAEAAREFDGDEADNPQFLPAFLDEADNVRYFHPRQVTVQFKPTMTDAEAEKVVKDMGGEILVRQRTRGYYTVSVPRQKTIFQAIREYNRDRAHVIFSEPDQLEFNSELESPRPQSEPDFADLWGIHNTGQSVRGAAGLPDCDVRAVDAWQTTLGDPNVIAVAIDTGADLDHPDLEPALLPMGTEDWDFADGPDTSPDDEGSHGTHVCGTIVGVVDGTGIVGVAPRCSLMPLRIDLTAGRNANRADALNYVAGQAVLNPGSRYVVNCSWRASGTFTAILVAIDNVVQSGGIVLFAAGNSGRDMDDGPAQFPGAHPTAIAVAALTNRFERASFSNYGSQVDVSAPGLDVWSSVPGSHDYKSGTSMACPHAAGVCCLIWSANPSLSNAEVREILESTCVDVTTHNPAMSGKLGAGLVNASAAVAESSSGRFGDGESRAIASSHGSDDESAKSSHGNDEAAEADDAVTMDAGAAAAFYLEKSVSAIQRRMPRLTDAE